MAEAIAKEEKRYNGFISYFIHLWFVVPKTQTKIFDLGYQLYTFELFHMKFINRLSHFIGIPLNLIALYCILLPINTWLAIGALTIVAGHHLIMAVKYRTYQMIPVLILFHALFYSLSVFAFEPFIFNGATWFQSPLFHFIFWPFIQYVTHGIETWLPRPWSLKGNWMKLKDYWVKAPIYKSVLMILFMPLHTFVELVSSWRNLYLELFLMTHKMGYSPKWFSVAQQWIFEEITSEDPVISYEDYKAAFEPIMQSQMESEESIPENLHAIA